MSFLEFLNDDLFSISGIAVSLADLLVLFIVLVLAILLGRWSRKVLRRYLKKGKLTTSIKSRIKWLTWVSLFLLGLGIMIYYFGEGVDVLLWESQKDEVEKNLRLSGVIFTLFFIILAHLVDLIFTSILSKDYLQRQSDLKGENFDKASAPVKTKRIIRPAIYTLVVLLIVYNFDVLNAVFFAFNSGENRIEFRMSNIISAVLIFFVARLIIWVSTEIALASYYRRKNVDAGSRYAVNQLLKYFIFTIALLSAIESLGINLTLIWGGAAALLVGIGLGLQQTFNDLTCGFILLFERTVEIDDVVEFDGMIGIVKKIGVRTSLIETRDNITVIVPNSKLVGEYVINWSHYRERSRFRVLVGVAYGTDVEVVRTCLLQACEGHDKIMQRPKPFVRFADFGDSSLNFELHFWSRELMRIENVKSDLRFEIYRLFAENNIEIPFPQRDVWLRKEG